MKVDEGLNLMIGLRPVAVHRRRYVNLYCKLGISRDQTENVYEPVLGLCKPTGVTHVYKGTTWRRFKENRQQLET